MYVNMSLIVDLFLYIGNPRLHHSINIIWSDLIPVTVNNCGLKQQKFI